MKEERIRLLANGWYASMEPPSAAEAVEHFQGRINKDPQNAAAYTAALTLFLKMRQAWSTYAPADTHADSLAFRDRMKGYRDESPD